MNARYSFFYILLYLFTQYEAVLRALKRDLVTDCLLRSAKGPQQEL